jgi:proteasome lid subunit RPN8/RPN11
VKIARAALDAIHAHAVEGYPYEICGMLVGRKGSPAVTRSVRATNAIRDRAHDTYRINPDEHRRIEREVDEAGDEILGYYHSHPDHPARASIRDTEQAWPRAYYLIVSCVRGEIAESNVFVSEDWQQPMKTQPLEVV